MTDISGPVWAPRPGARRRRCWPVVIGALALVAACSDDRPDAAGADSQDTEAATTDADAIGGVLSEWSVQVDQATAPAGEVTFMVANEGTIGHEFLVVRTDLPSGSIPVEGEAFSEENETIALINEIGEFPAGTTESLTLALEPGAYQLVCNLPGHYANGMHTAFTVTG